MRGVSSLLTFILLLCRTLELCLMVRTILNCRLTGALVARTEYKPHPNKISSLMFYLVVIIIHGMFIFNLADFRSLPYISR